MIEIPRETIDRVHSLLNEMKGGRAPQMVLQHAMKRAFVTARNEVAKAVSETYRITQREFKRNVKASSHYDSDDSELEIGLTYAGYVIPLVKFDVKPEFPNPRAKTAAVVKKSETYTTLSDAFVADFRYGMGVFERMTKRRDSITALYGPSAAHMAGNIDVTDRAAEKAYETFDKRVDAGINAFLSGYWSKNTKRSKTK